MGVNSSHKTVTGQRRGCDLNPGPTAPESSTLTTRLPSRPNPRRGRGRCRAGVRISAGHAEELLAEEYSGHEL